MEAELYKARRENERLRVCLKYADLYAFCVKYLKEKKSGKGLKRTAKSN